MERRVRPRGRKNGGAVQAVARGPREAAVLHLRNEFGVVHCVAAGRRRLVDAPDRAMVVAVAGNDFRGAQRAVRLARHERKWRVVDLLSKLLPRLV